MKKNELTPIEKHCQLFDCMITSIGVVKSPWNDTHKVKEYNFCINDVQFKYYQGIGITAPEPKDIMTCLLRDAWTAEQGLDYLVEDLGYEYKEAKGALSECENTLQKLQALGAYDEELAMQV